MNWEQIGGNWEKAKGEVEVRWVKLTDDDLALIAGERDKLVGRLQEPYGLSKEEVQRQIDELSQAIIDLASRCSIRLTTKGKSPMTECVK